MTEDEKQEREEYLRERTLLIDLEKTSSASFDKAMLTLSAGALVLSVSFFKDMEGTKSIPLLIGSWACFAASLLLTSWSFLFSQYAIRRQRGLFDDTFYPGDTSTEGHPSNNRWADWTARLNWMSIVAFTIGTIVLIIFASRNIGGVNR